MMAPCSWWSHSQETISPRTRRRSGVCTTPRPPWSARQTPSRRKLASRLGPKRAKRAWREYSRRQASRGSGGRRRRRSTSYWKRGSKSSSTAAGAKSLRRRRQKRRATWLAVLARQTQGEALRLDLHRALAGDLRREFRRADPASLRHVDGDGVGAGVLDLDIAAHARAV